MTDVIEQKRAAWTELCRRNRVRKLEVFGSATNDTYHPDRSDLDFLVEFEALPPAAHSQAYFDLWFALQDLFGCDVDLVEAPAVTNPYFLRTIAASRSVMYAA